jgi:probable phosphoglycerate mutase
MRWDGVTIYFVRHGQTDWNVERRFQGHLDIPLNDTGRAQAARNGAALARVIGDPACFDFVSNPLSRASETMAIIRRALALDPADYRTDARLREIHGGDDQGRLSHEIKTAIERDAGECPDARWHFQHPGGESYAMLYQRFTGWLETVKRDTVITGHGGVMRCLRRYVEGLDAEQALQMPVPQDRLVIIRDGALEWI